MSMKVALVAAASVLAVSPAFALTNSQIVHHTGGPIPYSQLVSMDKSGYSARTHKSKKAAATADQSVAANPAATPADQSAAPAPPTPSATPDASAAPAPAAPDAGPAPAGLPAAAPGSPGAAPQ